jgi:hypothetical protein
MNRAASPAALDPTFLTGAAGRAVAIAIVVLLLAALLLSVLAPALGMPTLAPTRWYPVAI